MSISIFRVGRYLTVMTTLLALIGMATSVQAASFRKTWDPEFSDDFSTLVGIDVGWKGEALIFVTDACVGLLPNPVIFIPNNNCGTSFLESYELTFYEVGSNNLLGMASGMAPGLPAVTAVSFDGMDIVDGVNLAGPILVPGSFFFGNYANSFQAELSFNLDLQVNGPSLRLIENCEGEVCRFYDNDGAKFPPTVEWSQVPAPAPLALLGIGLFALAMTRRRKA